LWRFGTRLPQKRLGNFGTCTLQTALLSTPADWRSDCTFTLGKHGKFLPQPFFDTYSRIKKSRATPALFCGGLIIARPFFAKQHIRPIGKPDGKLTSKSACLFFARPLV
jgi:hypothetical protein